MPQNRSATALRALRHGTHRYYVSRLGGKGNWHARACSSQNFRECVNPGVPVQLLIKAVPCVVWVPELL